MWKMDEIKVIVKIGTIIDSGYWEEYCEAYDVGVYSVNEGIMDEDDNAFISASDAFRYGVIKDTSEYIE
jgi:hypothetical protein